MTTALPKRRRLLPAIALAATLALTATACSSADSANGSAPAASKLSDEQKAAIEAVVFEGAEADLPTTFPEPEVQDGFEFTVGYSNPSAQVPSLVAQEEGARAEVERLGGKFISTDAQFSVQKQVSDFEQLLQQGVDAIILSSLDPNSLGPLLDKAEKQGVKVYVNDIPYRADMEYDERFSGGIFTGTDKSAYERAKLLAETKPGARYALVGVSIPAPMLDYKVSQVKYWAEKFGLEYVDRVDAKSDTPEAGAEAGAALLAKQPDLDAVFTATDSLSVGVSTAARSSSRSVWIVGNGGYRPALEAIRNGDLLATYWTDPRALHRQLVWAAYNDLTGQHEDQPDLVVLEGGRIITRDEVDSVKDPVG